MASAPESLWFFKHNELTTETVGFIAVTIHIDGLVQACSNSSALAMELLQSCTKPLILFPARHISTLIMTLHLIKQPQLDCLTKAFTCWVALKKKLKCYCVFAFDNSNAITGLWFDIYVYCLYFIVKDDKNLSIFFSIVFDDNGSIEYFINSVTLYTCCNLTIEN